MNVHDQLEAPLKKGEFRCGLCSHIWEGFDQSCPKCHGVESVGLGLPDENHQLISDEAIKARIATVAKALDERLLRTSNPVVGVTLLSGGVRFFADMQAVLKPRFTPVYLRTSRYNEGQKGGALKIEKKDLPQELVPGATVVVFDDLTDKGHTMHGVVQYLMSIGAAEVIVCVLLDKPLARDADAQVNIDFVCFEINDVWVFGYGMDDGKGNEWVRNLPDVHYYGKQMLDSDPGFRIP